MYIDSLSISTPCVVIDWGKCLVNMRDMAEFTKQKNLKLRPHIKAHKLPCIALEQIKLGAAGITASKLSEAEVMVQAGIKDILIAYPVVGQDKLDALMALAKSCHISTIVDNVDVARALSHRAVQEKLRIDVYIKIDTGLHRLGVKPGKDVVNLAKAISVMPGLVLKGLLTHAGHAYAATSPDEVYLIGKAEGEVLVSEQYRLAEHGLVTDEVSVGSTPTAKIAGKVSGVTEIRPGNYVFYDAIQVGLGVVPQHRCALRVITTVVSVPEPNRVIIDAGSKVLALDKGAHGTSVVNGFGIVVGHEDAIIERLSEEHGVIRWPEDKEIQPGQRLEIIPNHACTVINLADQVMIWRDAEPSQIVKVAARGKVK